MAILNVRDALDYIRLCDGDDDLRCAAEMVDAHYRDLSERYASLKVSFATEVDNAYDQAMQRKDEQIARLKEQVQLDAWRLTQARAATYAYPEDDNDE
jgi:hypothetical protein